jgi:sigma-54 dependent transcriptional regulator, acetoin dehydrogenase operon transcriptional activator AcoR
MKSAATIGDTEPEERPSRGAPPKYAVLLISSLGGSTAAVFAARGSLTVGRGEGASARPARRAGPAVASLRDTLLSRQHLKIAAGTRGYDIEDLGSRNGTLLDGRRLTKPMPLSEGAIVLFGNHVAVFRRISAAERDALAEEAAAPFGPIPTASPSLALTYARLRKLARTDMELLFVGETGVGKEVAARGVHAASGRRGPFLAINCASLPAALVESELFGYLAGAHSTATAAKPGLIESAEGGTLLLDEIGEMPSELQAKIFRFLQDRMIRPLGATRTRRVDVRVLAATSRLEVGPGRDALRPDLVARLGAEPVVIPPLRRRLEDVPPLVAHLGGAGLRSVEPAALRAMALYGWPLNVRELEKTIANALAMGTDGRVQLENLPAGIRGSLQRGAHIEARRREPRAAPGRVELEHLLKHHDGNVSGIARALDRQWTVVHRWLMRYGLTAGRFRKGKW